MCVSPPRWPRGCSYQCFALARLTRLTRPQPTGLPRSMGSSEPMGTGLVVDTPNWLQKSSNIIPQSNLGGVTTCGPANFNAIQLSSNQVGQCLTEACPICAKPTDIGPNQAVGGRVWPSLTCLRMPRSLGIFGEQSWRKFGVSAQEAGVVGSFLVRAGSTVRRRVCLPLAQHVGEARPKLPLLPSAESHADEREADAPEAAQASASGEFVGARRPHRRLRMPARDALRPHLWRVSREARS